MSTSSDNIKELLSSDKKIFNIFIQDNEPDDNLAGLVQAASGAEAPDLIICAAGQHPQIKVEHTQLINDAILKTHPEVKKPLIIAGTASNKWGQVTNIEGVKTQVTEINRELFKANPVPLTVSTDAFTALVSVFFNPKVEKIRINLTTEFTDLLLAINFAKDPIGTRDKLQALSTANVDKATYYTALLNSMNSFIDLGKNTPSDLKKIELFFTGAANLSSSHSQLLKLDPTTLSDQSSPWELAALFNPTEYSAKRSDGLEDSVAYYAAVTKAFNDLANTVQVRAYENFGSTNGLNSTLQFFPELAALIDEEVKNGNEAILNYLKHSSQWDLRGMKDDYPDLRGALEGIAKHNKITPDVMKTALDELDAMQMGYINNNASKTPAEKVDAKIAGILAQLGISLNAHFQPIVKAKDGSELTLPRDEDVLGHVSKFNSNYNALTNIFKGPQACLADLLGVAAEMLYRQNKLPGENLERVSVEWDPKTRYPKYTPNAHGNLMFYRLAKPTPSNEPAFFAESYAVTLTRWKQEVYEPLLNLVVSSIQFARGIEATAESQNNPNMTQSFI